jgi:hypothetical protein
MRAFVIALILATSVASGCGGKQARPQAGQAALPFPAARWVPGAPTYVFAAPTVREGQLALAELVEPALVAQVIGIDLTNPDALAQIGIDVEGSIAMFSAEIDPTIAVHLANPAAAQTFVDQQRGRGERDGVRLDWRIDGDWLLLHVAFAPHGDTSDWYAASKQPGAATWTARWDTARALSTAPSDLVGSVDLRTLTGKLGAHVSAFAACARQFETVRGVSVAFDIDAKAVAGKLAIDVGGGAQTITSNTLAAPPGWTAASARAPLAAQWNLDLRMVAAWVQPCLHGGPDLVAIVDQFGARTARGFAHSLDPDDKSGTGAVAIDLFHGRYFSSLLGQIPMRSKFERSRPFGAYKGKHLSVPFVATVDYVLDDRVFMIAMGDGLLERAASGGPPPPAPVFAFDVIPSGLPPDVWEWLLGEAGLPQPKLVAARLQRWNDIHLGAHLDRESLVIEARGNRR